MFKKFLLIVITITTLTSLTGCSLFSSDSEEQETAVTEEGDADTVEDSTEESATSDEETSSDEVASSDDEEEVVDDYPDDDYGDDETSTIAKGESSALPEEPVGDTKEETLYVDGSQDSTTEEPSSYRESAPVQDNFSDSGAGAGYVSVKKMKKTPYNVGATTINRLYIARQGDTMKGVAEKIYGEKSRSKDLLAWNPHFAGKDLKVGDKIYYSSPRNPADNSAILLYYEESGIQPSYYTAKNGDSIRRVSQKLLGHERSWMEVWATNDVESKWDMPSGTQLRYWPSGTTAAPIQQQAATEPAPTQPEEEVVPAEDSTMTETAAAPEESAPMTEETPPMDEDTAGAAAATTAQQEPPPPPPSEATPPPPPPPEAIPTPDANAAASEGGGLAAMMNGENDSMMMAALGGLLLLAAMILVVFIRRGRKKAYG